MDRLALPPCLNIIIQTLPEHFLCLVFCLLTSKCAKLQKHAEVLSHTRDIIVGTVNQFYLDFLCQCLRKVSFWWTLMICVCMNVGVHDTLSTVSVGIPCFTVKV